MAYCSGSSILESRGRAAAGVEQCSVVVITIAMSRTRVLVPAAVLTAVAVTAVVAVFDRMAAGLTTLVPSPTERWLLCYLTRSAAPPPSYLRPLPHHPPPFASPDHSPSLSLSLCQTLSLSPFLNLTL